ncbi:MAG: DUF4919 domain-containing protein [Flavobacteriia bacterium]|nr:DUF4919 domain-containing protein [Flavobacteriia bacterium]
MKLKTTLILLLSFFTLFAQEKEFKRPDYKSIEKNINDSKSEFYYPVLMEKLVKHDTLITADQYHHLYYGYVFNKNYAPYGSYSKRSELNELLKKQELSKEDYAKVISMAEEALVQNPFDLGMMNLLAIFKDYNGESEEAQKIAANMYGILETIVKSGDGKTCPTAYHVISPHDEYAIMGTAGIRSLGQALMGSCDLQRIDEDEFGISKLFFDISKPFSQLSDSFK